MPLGAVPMQGKAYQRPSQEPQHNLTSTPVLDEPAAEVDPPALVEFYGRPEEPEPWDGVEAGLDPDRDLPYWTSVGVHRFRMWHQVEPPECPPGPWCAPQNHRELIEVLQRYCRNDLPQDVLEAINVRLDLQDEIMERMKRPPSWMTLDLGDSTDLRQWSQFLRDIQVDSSAQTALKLLADDPSGWGPYEVNRILAHLFKDTASAIEGAAVLPRKSAWVSRSVQEALAALRNPDEWDCDHQRASGFVWTQNPSTERWAWHVAPRGASSTTTEYGPWSTMHQGIR